MKVVQVYLRAIAFVLLMVFPVQAAEVVTYYHTDPAGTPLALSDASGQVVWDADYKPFGEEGTIAGSRDNNRRFVGKEKDAETGLDYFGARYMAVETGRFLSPDPVRAVDQFSGQVNVSILDNPQRFNTYAYSLNNPYKYLDPDGEDPISFFTILGIVALGKAAGLGVAWLGMRGTSAAIGNPEIPDSYGPNGSKYHLNDLVDDVTVFTAVVNGAEGVAAVGVAGGGLLMEAGLSPGAYVAAARLGNSETVLAGAEGVVTGAFGIMQPPREMPKSPSEFITSVFFERVGRQARKKYKESK